MHVPTVAKKKKKVKQVEKRNSNKAALQLANLRIETVQARVQKVRRAMSADNNSKDESPESEVRSVSRSPPKILFPRDVDLSTQNEN